MRLYTWIDCFAWLLEICCDATRNMYVEAWSLHLKKKIIALVKVQKRATKGMEHFPNELKNKNQNLIKLNIAGYFWIIEQSLYTSAIS